MENKPLKGAYYSDPERLKEINARKRHKYATDTVYRAKVLEYLKLRNRADAYALSKGDPVYKAKMRASADVVNARRRHRYATDLAYREKIKRRKRNRSGAKG